VLGRSAAEGEVVARLQSMLGTDGAKAVEDLVLRARDSSLTATSVGLITMVLGATSVMGQLEASLNQIWDAPPRHSLPVVTAALRRLMHAGIILGMGLLILVSLITSTALAALNDLLLVHAPHLATVLPAVHAGVSLAISAGMFATLFKWLPNTRIAWRDVWLGGLVTALLFTAGRGLIALYLAHATSESIYGAAGSVVMLLLWIYYSAQILFIGAEFTEVYSRRLGSRSEPPEAPRSEPPEARRSEPPEAPRSEPSEAQRREPPEDDTAR
jgi:membrane protein